MKWINLNKILNNQVMVAAGHGDGHGEAKPALRFYLIGWGVPLIVVGIAGAIHLDQYFGAQVFFHSIHTY